MEYAIVIVGMGGRYMAWVPDLDDCRVAADTREGALDLVREEVKSSIKSSVEDAIENAMEEAEAVPEPSVSLADAMSGRLGEYAPQGVEATIVMADVDVKVVVEVEFEVSAEVRVEPPNGTTPEWTRPMTTREAIRMVQRDGWQHVRTRGSHRHFHHPRKPGMVTIPGPQGKDLSRQTLASIKRQAGLK